MEGENEINEKALIVEGFRQTKKKKTALERKMKT